MGTDDRHKKRKVRNTSRKRFEQKAVLIALEDTKSSKYYFQALLKDKKLTGKVVFAKHIGTDSGNVVEAIVTHERENPTQKYEKKWAVIDKDDYSKNQINGAIQRAKDLGICIAISNEAYELWILLHFQPLTRYTSRMELNSKLNTIFKERFGLEYSKSSQDIYGFIVGLQSEAIKNSKQLVATHIRNNGKLYPYTHNPLTMVFQLVECLNSLYEKEHNCNCFPLDD
ncbi:MAG TPA: RloB domain-containing protein [Campylobacterales bacterium]|nr:RloB domain-containing protein [Arcobacter sp.]HHB93912.1 RloB domain-containing protein [Campylobacterales bacterium]HHD80732.1 RloB domain-containing protein [Campylobacterales bacterium]